MIILNFQGVGARVREIDEGRYDRWLDTDRFETILE